jgi:hypothetical protein
MERCQAMFWRRVIEMMDSTQMGLTVQVMSVLLRTQTLI